VKKVHREKQPYITKKQSKENRKDKKGKSKNKKSTNKRVSNLSNDQKYHKKVTQKQQQQNSKLKCRKTVKTYD
jgi:hypothetical protein